MTAGWEKLLQLSKNNPLDNVVLTMSPLEPSDTILVTGLTASTLDVILKLILEDYIKQRDSVKSVTRLSPTQALVSFKSQQSTSS